jgi:hypothetical protein
MGGWAISQRTPSTISASRWWRSLGAGASSADAVRATRKISTAPSAKHAALTPKGTAMPTANRNAPMGGAII